MPGLSAELAYRFFLALFPFVIFLAALAAAVARAFGVADPSAEIIRAFGSTLPAGIAALLGEELQRIVDRQSAGLVSIAAVAALYFATGGTNALFKALQRAYGTPEPRPLWRRYPLAVLLTLLAGTITVFVAVVFLGLQIVGAETSAGLGIEPAWRVAIVLRWVIAIPLLTLAAAVLFRFGTVLRPPWRAITPGAVLFALGWLAFTYVFALYVDAVADYGATYGALGGVAGLLVWLYFSAFVLLLGAEVTASLFGVRSEKAPG